MDQERLTYIVNRKLAELARELAAECGSVSKCNIDGYVCVGAHDTFAWNWTPEATMAELIRVNK